MYVVVVVTDGVLDGLTSAVRATSCSSFELTPLGKSNCGSKEAEFEGEALSTSLTEASEAGNCTNGSNTGDSELLALAEAVLLSDNERDADRDTLAEKAGDTVAVPVPVLLDESDAESVEEADAAPVAESVAVIDVAALTDAAGDCEIETVAIAVVV